MAREWLQVAVGIPVAMGLLYALCWAPVWLYQLAAWRVGL